MGWGVEGDMLLNVMFGFDSRPIRAILETIDSVFISNTFSVN